MYGIPADLDLSALAGQAVLQVTPGPYSAVLHLANGHEITLECELLLNDQPLALQALAQVQGRHIFGATPQGDDGILLLLDDGSRLVLLDSNPDYESFQISGPSLNLVV